MIEALEAMLSELRQQEDRIRNSGDVAPANCWIDCYSVEKRSYARLRSDRPMFDGKQFMALGRVGSAEHRDWEVRMKRRDAIQEIKRRRFLVDELIDAELNCPIWEPDQAADEAA